MLSHIQYYWFIFRTALFEGLFRIPDEACPVCGMDTVWMTEGACFECALCGVLTWMKDPFTKSWCDKDHEKFVCLKRYRELMKVRSKAQLRVEMVTGLQPADSTTSMVEFTMEAY